MRCFTALHDPATVSHRIRMFELWHRAVPRMKRLAITGGIACGKSLCGDFLRDMGCPVCDTDALAHELLEKDNPFYAAVVRRFGADILDRDGDIDRRRLGRWVFNDKEALSDLNALLHPEIKRRVTRWFEEQPQGTTVAAALIPLFFETGERLRDWDHVICVAAPEHLCRQRLRRRGWSATEIDERCRAQWSLTEKILRADIVLYNNAKPAWLGSQVETVWRRII